MELMQTLERTEFGQIPEGWTETSVADAFEVCNNLRMPISQALREKMMGDYPYYGPTSIQGWINEFRVEGEYALIGEDGDHFLKWRTQPMTLLVRGRFNVNNHAHLVRGSKNLTEWFSWYFANRDITQHLTRQGASRYKLNKATLLRLPCLLPPLGEQRAIATALSDVDALLAKLDQLIDKKRDLKQATMQQLLTGQTRLPGFDGKWEVKRLGELLSYEQPTPYLVRSVDYDSGNSVPVLTAGKTFILGYTNERDGVYPNPPVIIFDDFTTASKFVDFPFKAKSSAMKILKAREGRADIRFVFERMQIISFQLGDHKRYWISEYSRLPIKTPSLSEQTAIAATLTDMNAELSALEARRDKTRAIKQGMMQELLTGRIRLV